MISEESTGLIIPSQGNLFRNLICFVEQGSAVLIEYEASETV